MHCPHCQTAQPDPPPRFCDACGLATGLARPAASGAKTKAKADVPELRCNECGLVAVSRRCRGCGGKIRWPDDAIPPDEQPERISGLVADGLDAGGFAGGESAGGDTGGGAGGGGGESVGEG